MDNHWHKTLFGLLCPVLRMSKYSLRLLAEIPNPKKINEFKKDMKYAVFKQLHFYYKLNLHSTKNPYWYGSRICVKKHLKSPQWLRNLKFKKRPFWRFDKFRLNNIIDDAKDINSYLVWCI